MLWRWVHLFRKPIYNNENQLFLEINSKSGNRYESFILIIDQCFKDSKSHVTVACLFQTVILNFLAHRNVLLSPILLCVYFVVQNSIIAGGLRVQIGRRR